LLRCNAGGIVDELSESVDATTNQREADMTSFDDDKPPLTSRASVADLSPAPVSRSPPTPDAVVDPIKPGHAASDEPIAETTSRVSPTLSPSDAICRQSLTPVDRVSTCPTEMSEREESKPELQSTALSGIVKLCCPSVCLYVINVKT